MISNKNKNKFLEELEKNPIIQSACKKTNVAKSSYYRWFKTDKKFKKEVEKALHEGRSLVNDIAESRLIYSIHNGNLTAIIYWLKNNNSRYSEKIDNLSPKEQKKFVRRFLLSNPKDAYQILSEMALNKQLSKQTLNHFKYINSQLSKDNNKKLSPEEKGKKMQSMTIVERVVPSNPDLKKLVKANSQKCP